MYTTSLAGTDTIYRVIQARRWNPNVLHFQIENSDSHINRPYGVAFNVLAEDAIIIAVDNAKEKTKSLSDGNTEYAVLQARLTSPNCLHVQAKTLSYNREYGAAFDVIVPKNISLAVII